MMKKQKFNTPEAKTFAVYSALMLLFWLVCTKLIVKTDDGHFLGILANEGFTLGDWLKTRYETVSGRTINEAVMMSFLRLNPIVWKLFSFSLCAYITYFIYKVSLVFDKDGNGSGLALFSCCSLFLVGIGALNSGAFWFSGSFTFLMPCAFMFLSISPSVFSVLEIKCPTAIRILAVPAALLAASQEQASVCTCALLICTGVFAVITKKFRIWDYLPLIPAIAATVYLLTAPGVHNRGLLHASGSFSAYADFGIIRKLLLGLSNYYAYSFFTSVFVTIVFVALLSVVIYENCGDMKKKFAKALFGSVIFVCGVFNLLHLVFEKTSFDKAFQKNFENVTFDFWFYATLAVCTAVLCLAGYGIIIWARVNPKAALSVGLLCSAAVGCALVMGFSSSIYDSGQRVFFFTDMLMLTANAILIANCKKTKLTKVILALSVTVASVFYIINVFSFLFMEIPIMG